MINLRTKLKVADNSGAKELIVLHAHGKIKKGADLGDVVTAAVYKADPVSEIPQHTMVKAVIVRKRKEKRRLDGSYIRFDDNAAVIIENVKSKNPKATRIFGPIARELRDRGYDKIASLAKEVY